MRLAEILERIVKLGKIKDKSIGTLTEWIVENEGKETVSKYLSAISEDEIITLTPDGKQKGKIVFNRLKHSPFFNGLAIKYSKKSWFEESENIFKAILTKTPNDIDSILNYGAITLDMILTLFRQEEGIRKDLLVRGRSLIFKAYRYDKKVHEDWRIKPAYKNLCYLRAIESVYHYTRGEFFTAFVLGWLSIEMSLYRIWYQFIKNKTSEDLMRWSSDYVIETLLLGNINTDFRSMKKHLDTLKGIRNKLLHGNIDNPTLGDVRLCIDIALGLIPILQS